MSSWVVSDPEALRVKTLQSSSAKTFGMRTWQETASPLSSSPLVSFACEVIYSEGYLCLLWGKGTGLKGKQQQTVCQEGAKRLWVWTSLFHDWNYDSIFDFTQTTELYICMELTYYLTLELSNMSFLRLFQLILLLPGPKWLIKSINSCQGLSSVAELQKPS